MSYITKGDKVVPCEMHPKKKKCMDSKKHEECDLKKVCVAGLSETGHRQDEDHESAAEVDDLDDEEVDDEADDTADDEDSEEKLATTTEPGLATKPTKKGFLHNSFVQIGSDLEKGQCYEREEASEEN